jgi:hypothetical protein
MSFLGTCSNAFIGYIAKLFNSLCNNNVARSQVHNHIQYEYEYIYIYIANKQIANPMINNIPIFSNN